MVAAAKAAVPTVGDQAAALQLGNFAKATASALAELRSSAGKVSPRFVDTIVCLCSTLSISYLLFHILFNIEHSVEVV